MNYKYDDYGWYAGETTDTDRVTDQVPPILDTNRVVGRPYPNYYGYNWVLAIYSEPPVNTPTYKVLNQLQFIELCQEVGGMTDDALVAAKNDILLAAMWIKFNAAKEFAINDIRTVKGLEVLEALGYLQKSVQYIIANWPIA